MRTQNFIEGCEKLIGSVRPLFFRMSAKGEYWDIGAKFCVIVSSGFLADIVLIIRRGFS